MHVFGRSEGGIKYTLKKVREMKLLLTTTKSDNKRTDLAMKYMYSVVADSPMNVTLRIFDRNTGYIDMYEEIAGSQYNIVYFHCDEYNINKLLHVAEMVKKAIPSIAIIFGGMEVSFHTRVFMKDHPQVDYVIRGEGERVLFNFIKSIMNYEYDFENIAGLAYREDDAVVVNPFDAPIDMESLPFPYERFEAGKGTVYYESIRGTSDRSAYAQYLPDARVRTLPLGRICTEIRYFLACEVERVVFLDRWFNYNSERAYRIFEYIIHNDNGITSFEFNINGDDLDEETLRLLAEARNGQIMLNADLASTNSEVLATIGRNENVYRLMYNITKLIQGGKVETNIIVRTGLPMESEEMFARSFNKAYGMAEGMPVHIESIRISKGSRLREEAGRFGYIYSDEAPYDVISSGYMSADEMLKLSFIAKTVESYIGDGGFKNSIPKMLNDTGLKPYELFRSLTAYIRRNKLSGKMKKKEHLARILYSFAGGLYDELSDAIKLDVLRDVIYAELESELSEDAMRKFDRKGWDIGIKAVEEVTEEEETDTEEI